MKSIFNFKKGVSTIAFLVVFMFSTIISSAQTSKVSNKDTYTHVTSTSNGVSKIHVKNKKNDFSVEYEGKITLSDDDKDIVDISRGGFIEIKKSSFGKKRKIVIEAESGKLNKKYYVGWSEKAYNPEGKAWLAEILPEIVRSTVIAAESRVNRFYNRGGVDAVLAEIRLLESDFVQSKYFGYLLEKDLNNSALVKVIQSAGKNIKSDYYLAQTLQKNQKAFLSSSETLSAYIKASNNIGSDYYLSQVLRKAIKTNDISDNQLTDLLQISGSIGSDHYLSQVLSDILNNRELNKSNMNKIMKLSKNIGSDYYKTQVLKKALKKKNLSSENYDTFISSMDDVGSDHYASNIIKELLKKDLDNKSLDKLLELVSKNVSSDYYASGIYKKLAKKKLTESQLIRTLKSMKKSMSSNNYLSSSLVAFAPQVKNSNQRVKDTYMNVAKSLSSDTYFGRAMKAIY
ncbi:hypothetical protein [uncultured Tenacibaculum sp.]|uniref:hypothetical protein n=1 Tax=uncultured Tenacibaculum sp. TaxID=174713 RepID=UPI002604503F|nr:hypothetical protein [uncultured Tenacibaculum sp.]